MKRKKNSLKSYIYIFALFFYSVISFISCATEVPVKDIHLHLPETDFSSEKYESKGTILKTPDRKNFEKQIEQAPFIKDIEKGSVISLKKAAEYIQYNSFGLREENKLYLAIASKFMEILYPYEKIDWALNLNSQKSKYLSAIAEVQKGVYPYWLDTGSFFSLIIPPMMLTAGNFPKIFHKDSLERLEDARKLHPESVLPYYLEGLLFEMQKNTAKAYLSYKKAWEMDFSCYPAGIRLAKLAALNGKTKEALNIAGILQERYKNNAEILLLSAESFLAQKNRNAAEPFITEALAHDPENKQALLLYIEMLIEKREYLKADSFLKVYSSKNKTEKKYLLLKARVAREWTKNQTAALQDLAAAHSYYPDDFEVLLACADACFETGQKINGKTADDFIRGVSALEPDNQQIVRLLLKNDISEGNWRKALEAARKLNARYPSAENSRLLLQVYLGIGKNNEALIIAEKLYRNSALPQDEITALYLESLYRTGNGKRISAIVNRHMKNSRPEQKSVLHYYNALLLKDEPETYLSEMRSALLANPRNISALFAMYEWYFKNKDYRNARFYLRQVIALEPGNTKYIKLSENLSALLAR